MVQLVSSEFSYSLTEFPKVDEKLLLTTHHMLDTLFALQPEQDQPNIDENSSESQPHRWSGAAPHASTLQAVRSAMTDRTLPEYREISNARRTDADDKSPAINLNLFCEVGPYAQLDPTHRQKLSAVALWKPKNPQDVVIRFFPLFSEITSSSLGNISSEIRFHPEESDETRLGKLMDLYNLSYAQRPSPILDIERSDTINTQNPEQDTSRLIADIDLKAHTSHEKNLFMVISPSHGFENRPRTAIWAKTKIKQVSDNIWGAVLSTPDPDYFTFTKFPKHLY